MFSDTISNIAFCVSNENSLVLVVKFNESVVLIEKSKFLI